MTKPTMLDSAVADMMLNAVGDAARRGHDLGEALADPYEKRTEAEAVRLAAGKLEQDWWWWLDQETFRDAVVETLESRLVGAVNCDAGKVEVDERSGTIRFRGEALGASYASDPNDPYDYVEAPAPRDDHSRRIAAALAATGAAASVSHKIVNDPQFTDLQHLVFNVAATWNLADFDHLVPDEVKNAFTQGVRAGFRDARAA